MIIIKNLLARGTGLTLGLGALWTANQAFDWVLYPYVMCRAGQLEGALLMTGLSVPFNFLLIKGYDLLGRDLFALELTKERQRNPTNWFWHLISKARWVTFVALSAYDPVPAVVYAREGKHQYNGLSRRDWQFLALATIIANTVWVALIILGFATAEHVGSELLGLCLQ